MFGINYSEGLPYYFLLTLLLMDTIKILIADDHKLYREGIKSLLEDEENIDISIEVSSGVEVLEKLKKQPVDIILMDIDMPDMNGIEATRAVKELYPETRILILSMYDNLEFILDVLKAGASGYLLKSTESLDLVSAIKALALGSCYYSEKVSNKLCEYLNQINVNAFSDDKAAVAQPVLTQQANLTKRELEILQLIGKEYTNQEIADELFISTNTVFTHRKNLMKKLNVRNMAGLIRYASKYGII